MSRADVIVIGLGAMGSATVYQLAKRGISVIGIDRWHPPHTLGSSHGESRVTRTAIAEGDVYAPLALRSHQIWREVEAEGEVSLLNQCGFAIIASQDAGEQPMHGKRGLFDTALAVAGKHGIDYELLDSVAAQSRWPELRLTADERVMFEPTGGYVLPELAVETQLSLARRRGAQLLFDSAVASIRSSAEGATVELTTGEKLHGGHVVGAAGGWTSQVFPGVFNGLLTIQRKLMCWFEITSGDAGVFSPERFPTYIWLRGDVHKYGFPAITGREDGIKIGEEWDTPAAHAGSVDRAIGEDEKQRFWSELVDGYFNGVGSKILRAVTCFFTRTPDGDFIIDAVPEAPGVTVISACSGHGFKHSPAIGEAVCERIIDGKSRIDLAPFALSRFA